MSAEEQIVDFVCNAKYTDFPAAALETVRNMLVADLGTTIAGAQADGCRELVEFHRRQGGAQEATLLLHGGRVPAQHAAMVNGVMSRALDFCDAIAPGAHIGSSIIPAGLACAELRGGVDGREFLAALTVGAEIGARFNLTEAAYNGFDPTGVSVPFAATAVACRLLRLDRTQTWNALGIAFNRCGGSFQSNIDGSLSVRANQGWVAQDAVLSARLAQHGLTGPRNFIEGIYGYVFLYGRNLITAENIAGNLGKEHRLLQMMFKKYPSCGATQGCTEVMLGLLSEHGIAPADIAQIRLTLPPYAHRLVGHEFRIGDNPTVDGQFSAQYCLANVLLRGASRIRHFTAEEVRDPAIRRYLPLISVIADPALDARGHTALDLDLRLRDGRELRRQLDIAPGFPGNPLTPDGHQQRFHDCIDFAAGWFDGARAERVLAAIRGIESVADVCSLIELLTPGAGQVRGVVQKR